MAAKPVWSGLVSIRTFRLCPIEQEEEKEDSHLSLNLRHLCLIFIPGLVPSIFFIVCNLIYNVSINSGSSSHQFSYFNISIELTKPPD